MSQCYGAGKGVYELVDSVDTEPAMADTNNPVAGYRSLLQHFLLRLCVALTLGVLLLVLGELTAYWRHLPEDEKAMDLTVKVGSANARGAEREYWRQFEAADRVTYHPYVLWRRAPFQGSMINIDSNGIRQTVHSQCNDTNFTIWVFGDSTMWGAGATDEQTIPSRLAADYAHAGRPACVVNYGEKAWANTQEVIALMEQLKHATHRPNVVVFYDGGTEAFAAYQTHRADVPSNYASFAKYLDDWNLQHKPGFSYLQQTNSYRLLNGLSKKLGLQETKRPAPMSDEQLQSLATAIVRNYEQNMDIVGLLAQQYGFRPIFAWYPTLVVGHKPLTPAEELAKQEEEERFPGMARIYQAAYQKCQQTQRANLYYLGDVFDDEKSSLFLGISHIKPEGNRIIADRLYQIIEQPVNSNDDSKSTRRHGQHVASKPA